jgi:malate dehydrogenase (oxaloacetate-decarboxylating)
VAEAGEIRDELFLTAADTLAGLVSDARARRGRPLPSQSEVRAVLREVAIALVRPARDLGVGRVLTDERIAEAVDPALWFPRYPPYGCGAAASLRASIPAPAAAGRPERRPTEVSPQT